MIDVKFKEGYPDHISIPRSSKRSNFPELTQQGTLVETIVSQHHITRSRYGIGSGKAEEVKELVEQLQPQVIIFDEVLKPSQQYNLASLCKIEILDRERLILEIFERRASTAESRYQIKLAQLRYDMIQSSRKS